MGLINNVSTRIFQALFIGLGLGSIIAIWKLGNPLWAWVGVAISISLEMGRSLYIKSRKSEGQEKRDILFRLFFYGIRVIIIILLIVGLTGGIAIFINSDCASCAIYKAMGVVVIILWTCVFLGYFLWSLYFYNVNLGLTEEEWDKIKKEKAKKDTGQFFSQDVIDEEPRYNPYNDQTFGLPPGTVRGMIAFTLLFGAIALIIVSIGIKNSSEESALVRDQFDFFKNAFLMMIAFYFGSRSLETLTKSPKQQSDQTDPGGGGVGSPGGSLPTDPTPKGVKQPPVTSDQPAPAVSSPAISSDDVIVNVIDPMQKPV